MKTNQTKPIGSSMLDVFPVLLLLLLIASRASAAAPQIIPSMTFQQSAVDLGNTNIFTVNVSGDAPLSFQWRRNDSDVLSETTNSLVVGPAQPADEGDYTVVVTNVFGAVTSSPVRLWVVPRQTDFVKDNFTNSTGMRLPYFYLLPNGYDPARRYPLHYWLHGIPGDETVVTNANYGYPGYGAYPGLKVLASFRQQETDPVILVWPARRAGDAYGDWNSQYMGLLSALLDHLLVQFSVDTNRIYVEGPSGGMHAAWDLLVMRPGFFAAGRFAAGWQGSFPATYLKDTPLWIWCAANDDAGQTANTRQAVRSLRQAGGNPIYTEYLVGGHMNGIGIGCLTPVMVDWMLAQRRGQPATNQPLLTITSPSLASAYLTARAALDLSGSAGALDQAIINVSWTNFGSHATGVASGTNVWNVANISLAANRTNLITVVATTTSWASAYGGNTTFNDTLTVVQSPILATLTLQGTEADLNWTGGAPPFRVQRTTDPTANAWTDYLIDVVPPVSLSLTGQAGFYRILGQ